MQRCQRWSRYASNVSVSLSVAVNPLIIQGQTSLLVHVTQFCARTRPCHLGLSALHAPCMHHIPLFFHLGQYLKFDTGHVNSKFCFYIYYKVIFQTLVRRLEGKVTVSSFECIVANRLSGCSLHTFLVGRSNTPTY